MFMTKDFKIQIERKEGGKVETNFEPQMDLREIIDILKWLANEMQVDLITKRTAAEVLKSIADTGKIIAPSVGAVNQLIKNKM